MANNQKTAKKVATKAPKVHGAAKLPKYAQSEAASSVITPSAKPAATGKK